jgi:ribosomal protein L11 methyltransferase
VLSVLAEKLGATDVLAVECDSWSVENATENIAINNCRRVEVVAAERLPEGRTCEVLLANINRHILLEHLPAMLAATRPGGSWLLSGLLAENEDEMRQRCTGLGLHWRHTHHRNGWISMLFDR